MLKVQTIYSVDEIGFNVDNICYIKDLKLKTNIGISIDLDNYKKPSKSDLFYWSGGGVDKIIEAHEKNKTYNICFNR